MLLLSYWHKLSRVEAAGITSEMSGLTTYLVGVLVYHDHFWIATALSVASLLLLELKEVLETLARRTAPQEILTFGKFLLLTAVILPILPNQEFGRFHLNPFNTWLVVVAVSTIPSGSYVLQKVTKERGGVVLAAFLGGAYSSTVVTVAMSRRAAREQRPHLFAGGILIASGVMYRRLAALLTLFNRRRGIMLAPRCSSSPRSPSQPGGCGPADPTPWLLRSNMNSSPIIPGTAGCLLVRSFLSCDAGSLPSWLSVILDVLESTSSPR